MFKPGQRIRCVDPYEPKGIYYGKIYVVVSCRHSFYSDVVRIKGTDFNFCVSRFVLAQEYTNEEELC